MERDGIHVASYVTELNPKKQLERKLHETVCLVMSLSAKDIRHAKSDEQLFKLLSSELNCRLPDGAGGNLDDQVRFVRSLPRGLRAMAAIHRLEVSMALDDLGWHFYNFHSRELAAETLSGLLELGASEAAEVFKKALELVEAHWESIGELKAKPLDAFTDWYTASGLEEALDPLNDRLWALCTAAGNRGLLSYWLTYARKYPERVTDQN
jgi:hypothetical protein